MLVHDSSFINLVGLSFIRSTHCVKVIRVIQSDYNPQPQGRFNMIIEQNERKLVHKQLTSAILKTETKAGMLY